MGFTFRGLPHIATISLLLFSAVTPLCFGGELSFPSVYECLRHELQHVATLDNYYSEAKILNLRVIELLKSLSPTLSNNWSEFSYYTDDLFTHVMQNTVQHGSRELQAYRPDYESAEALAISKIQVEGSYVVVSVSNPQIKPFPRSLIGTFFSGEAVSIPDSQRAGFRGGGWAHNLIIRDLNVLPAGSSAQWEADGKTVKFTLRIRVR